MADESLENQMVWPVFEIGLELVAVDAAELAEVVAVASALAVGLAIFAAAAAAVVVSFAVPVPVSVPVAAAKYEAH